MLIGLREVDLQPDRVLEELTVEVPMTLGHSSGSRDEFGQVVTDTCYSIILLSRPVDNRWKGTYGDLLQALKSKNVELSIYGKLPESGVGWTDGWS